MTDNDFLKIDNYIRIKVVRSFYSKRIQRLDKLTPELLLKSRNPFLSAVTGVSDIGSWLDVNINTWSASSDETILGNLLDQLSMYISRLLWNAKTKKPIGADIDFIRNGCRYVIELKSGEHWGNSAQYKTLVDRFSSIVAEHKSLYDIPIEPILGIYYGPSGCNKSYRGYTKICGPSFWEFLTESPDFHKHLLSRLSLVSSQTISKLKNKQEKTVSRILSGLGDYTENNRLCLSRVLDYNSGHGRI
jgi:hypothetical protein